MTWSIERALIGATQGIWGICGAFGRLEELTRPPRLGHDVDVEDGAEQLAEREAETECLVPEDFNAVCRCVACVAEEQASAVEYDNDPPPTIVQSAPPPTVDGEGPSEVSGPPVPPSEGRPPHPVPREQRQGTYCEDYETDGCSVDGCPIGCYLALKFRDDAAAEWIGGAVPVICGVLARHVPVNTSKHTPSVFCNSITGQYCHEYADWQAWREHVAPLIAEALAPKPK